jgi:hypothetical protein
MSALRRERSISAARSSESEAGPASRAASVRSRSVAASSGMTYYVMSADIR